MITQVKKRSKIIILSLILVIMPGLLYSAEYKIDAGDVILITVYEQPDLITKARVNSKGEITFPLLGNVQIKGLTVDEVEDTIRELLEKDYLVDPQVTVFIEDYRAEKVFVMGFVNEPGEYELFKDRPTTVLEAITMAGGFKEGAAQNGTKVIRVEDGNQVTIPIRITDITKKGDKAKDITINPGDIIVVPESFF
ncbi:MAG: polysaccharide export protein [Candidatus Omnitrophica bacterium]|nr:polysaccharide export protein [Candidatus Omnitrophota bacterium]MBU4590676.1 polysaccharide export protein [Candidatus Omnitrophota bacterium]